ncbi:hypothetical protein Palpr_2678 [Paludibacter propionicigenes WB4]|uniref:Uncharacterized protein n=1 Tax=Paludibacter propionicigenes (strain DSM 17365 / JCM 13257 / WB4) TaxID=694427 RepID=E4T7W4_PALPW|nr:hypothetical protein [Paludibacter propionicigenes]ADQ80808.1 hypothetical protein Palpr_2678 [Paludibacter propionicigenes WB4]
MKQLKLFAFGVLLMFVGSTQAQLSVNLHIGTPPAWGPAGYNDVRYYYLPDVEAYYDVRSSMFIYISGNRWVHRSHLPGRYRNYDLYGGYKVVMNDYRGNSPYSHFREHRMKYARGYRGNPQRNIGIRNNGHERHNDFQPDRYDGRRNEHSRMKENNQERGNDKGRGHGNEKKQERGNDKRDGHDNGNRK